MKQDLSEKIIKYFFLYIVLPTPILYFLFTGLWQYSVFLIFLFGFVILIFKVMSTTSQDVVVDPKNRILKVGNTEYAITNETIVFKHTYSFTNNTNTRKNAFALTDPSLPEDMSLANELLRFNSIRMDPRRLRVRRIWTTDLQLLDGSFVYINSTIDVSGYDEYRLMGSRIAELMGMQMREMNISIDQAFKKYINDHHGSHILE